MFEESLVESAALLRTHNRLPALLSLSAQLLVAGMILALPLLHPEALPGARAFTAHLAPPPPPTPPPPVHLRPVPAAVSTPAVSAPASPASTPILRDLLHPSGPSLDAPALGVIDLGLRGPSLPAGIDTMAPGKPHITVAPAPRPSGAPLSISSGVTAGHLLAAIRPDYPAIARTAGVQGTVVIDAVISPRGSIESAHVLSGPTLLQAAALAAVRQARYRPFLLNGQPTAVQTTITIHFRLGS